jgi:gluconate 2-dehydrogenase gamma chain
MVQETGFLTLNVSEQPLVESIAETIIPTDSSGPGAKEAGVIYFIDRQLAGEYGISGNMFMQGPFVATGQKGPITVDKITYSDGSPPVRIGAGTRYQYSLNLREYWRTGLEALQTYANGAFGNNFEKLSSSQKEQILQDLWVNKPTTFNDILPEDFAYELFMMVWSGFLMDPLHGGNKGMVGWDLLGFTCTNTGNFYGEGKTPQQLIRLQG